MNNYEVVIVGAGQAGLAMGYYLSKTDISFLLLDANQRIGDSWRNRYESLVLFTPRCYGFLPGLKMTGLPKVFPQKTNWPITWSFTQSILKYRLNLILMYRK